jgi:CHAT domain-containing protein
VAVTVLPGHTELAENVRQQLEEVRFKVEDGETSLSNILRHLQGKHVLHFLGHGRFQKDKGQGGRASLYLEKAGGGWQVVGDETIVEQLGNLRPQPLLVFLAACESGKGAGQGPFAGLGPKLVQAGVPAVVAMREQVEMGMARDLTRDFYRRLLDHGEVDRALNEARNLLLSSPSGDWAIPVLYMRLRDGRLLKKGAGATPRQPVGTRPKLVDPAPPGPAADQRTYTTGPLDRESRVRIRKNLVQYFNLPELKTICSDLGIDYENFPSTKDGLARELLLYCERRGRVPDLIETVRLEQPTVDW